MTYNPLTDDIVIAVEAAQERARSAQLPDGSFPLEHLLSGFDLHPKVMAGLIADQVDNHNGRLNAGANVPTVLTSLYVGGLMVGLFLGEVREARRIAAKDAA